MECLGKLYGPFIRTSNVSVPLTEFSLLLCKKTATTLNPLRKLTVTCEYGDLNVSGQGRIGPNG